MAFTPRFVFTDPVAAQQAVQYAQLASQEQAMQDQAFNERMRNATQGRIAQQNTQQQQMFSQSQMQQRAAENEKDRELARQGYANAQTVAGIASGGRLGPVDARLKAQQDADAAALAKQTQDNFAMGNDYAAIINNKTIPDSIKRKFIESGHVTVDPKTGLYIGRYPNPNPPAENIQEIMSRAMIPSPSQGGSPSRGSLMNRNITVTATSPRLSDLSGSGGVYSPIPESIRAQPAFEPSPFETEGFKVFRQSDFIPRPPPAYDSSGMEAYQY